MTGAVLAMVVTLVLAIFALVLLWAFLSGAIPVISNAISGVTDGLKKAVCDKLGITKGLFGCSYF
jgi:hypothetical protein